MAFGTYDVRSHPRVGVLIQGVRDLGHEVVEVNRPLGIDTAQRIAMVQQPWRLPLLAVRLLTCWAALARLGVQLRRRRGQPDAVLVGYLGHFDVHLARLVFRGTPIILDHLVSAAGTARDRGLAGGSGAKARLLRAIDSAALGAADVVVLDTEQRRASLPAGLRARVAVCPVGATDEWFKAGSAALARPPGPRLRLIFVGLYTPLHGTPTLAEALALLAGDDRVEITMVGKGQERPLAERLASPNPRVTWIDWVSSSDLASLVSEHDVTLGIFGTTAKALEVVPTKVYQGAAAATVIVTSDTEPQRAALGDAAVLVAPGDSAALAASIASLADDPATVLRLRQAAFERARQRFTAAAAAKPALDALAAEAGLRSGDG